MDLTPILQAVIGILAALVTAFVIPFINSKTTAQQRSDILAWVEIAVAAAEQIKGLTTGSDKKKYVLSFLSEKGFKIDSTELDAMIEAAVYEIKNMVV